MPQFHPSDLRGLSSVISYFPGISLFFIFQNFRVLSISTCKEIFNFEIPKAYLEGFKSLIVIIDKVEWKSLPAGDQRNSHAPRIPCFVFHANWHAPVRLKYATLLFRKPSVRAALPAMFLPRLRACSYALFTHRRPD